MLQSRPTCPERVVNSPVLDATLPVCKPKIWGGGGAVRQPWAAFPLPSAHSPEKVFLENLINLPSLSLPFDTIFNSTWTFSSGKY